MKYKILGVIGAILIAYALGRHLAQMYLDRNTPMTLIIQLSHYWDVYLALSLGGWLYVWSIIKRTRA